jgi:bifunctional DNA-binding transcriptional regulator/antitoxin component of YhaV-PrlF toxin-antitoxin module
MQQVAVTEVQENGAGIPAEVLRVLGVSRGDRVAFFENDDGSVALTKATASVPKRPIRDFVGIFATDVQRSLEDEVALLREIRYGDEVESAC